AAITDTLNGATIGSENLEASGVTFNVDTTSVTYFVTEIFGRDEAGSFEVVIIDDDLPDMTCPTPDALPTDPNSCEATVPLAAILPTGIIDNCGIDSVTYEFTTGPLIGNGLVPSVPTVYPIGTTEITYRAYDVNGNVRVCDVFIVVNDTQGPTTDCPADVTINVPNGTVDTVLNGLGILNAADVCGDVVDTSFTTAPIIPTVGTLDISGTAFPVGETLVTYTTLDDSGNAGTCSFTVNVIEDPGSDLIDCPTDMDVCNPIVTAPPIYLVDPSTITLSYTTSTVAGGTGELTNVTLPTGPTVVTYTAVNSLNESDVCSFNINVDNEAPTFLDCPGGGLPLVFETAMGSCTASATWDIPTPTDNCGLESVTFTHVPPVDLAVGSHDIMYTATDTAGNVGTCSFTVIINDTEAPVWDNCPPADVVLTPTGNGCDAVATWTAPTATDACSVNIVYATNDDIMPGDTFATTTTVIYTATDESGNTAVCTFEIVVEDTQDPVPNCPDDITIDADPTICGYIAAWVLPTATDDCSNVGISCTHMPGDTIGIGQTIVVCTAIDAAGNDASCTFTVTVVDNSPPVIMDCPVSPITSNVTPDSCGAFVTWDMITAMDDCDTTLTITTNFDSGDYFPVGTTTVTYTATDDGNNAVTCSFDVIVEDDEAPVIDCPENVVIDASGNIIDDPSGILTSVSNNNTCDSVTVEFNSPTITDNCGTVNSSIIGLTSGDTIAVGVYEIT
ncbi:MAG: HYR domain-containing protein, partial [Saprospiraceae bacterium]